MRSFALLASLGTTEALGLNFRFLVRFPNNRSIPIYINETTGAYLPDVDIVYDNPNYLEDYIAFTTPAPTPLAPAAAGASGSSSDAADGSGGAGAASGADVSSDIASDSGYGGAGSGAGSGSSASQAHPFSGMSKEVEDYIQDANNYLEHFDGYMTPNYTAAAGGSNGAAGANGTMSMLSMDAQEEAKIKQVLPALLHLDGGLTSAEMQRRLQTKATPRTRLARALYSETAPEWYNNFIVNSLQVQPETVFLKETGRKQRAISAHTELDAEDEQEQAEEAEAASLTEGATEEEAEAEEAEEAEEPEEWEEEARAAEDEEEE